MSKVIHYGVYIQIHALLGSKPKTSKTDCGKRSVNVTGDELSVTCPECIESLHTMNKAAASMGLPKPHPKI